MSKLFSYLTSWYTSTMDYYYGKPEQAFCVKCKTVPASFRGSFYFPRGNPDEIGEITNHIHEKFKDSFDQFWFRTITTNKTHEKQFKCCTNCANDMVKGYFTFLLNGWTENDNYPISYEKIDLN